MRYSLALIVFLGTALPALGQENDAEKLFRAMEKKIKEARTLRVSGEVEAKIGKGGTLKFELLVGEGNKARLELAGNIEGMDLKIALASDGKTTTITAMPFGANDSQPTEEKQNARLLALCSRGGVFFGAMFSTLGAAKGQDLGDADKTFAVSDFKMGRKEKVGDREATMFSFKMTIPGSGAEDALVTIWLDPATRLPLKRKLEPLGDKNKGEYLIETYSQFQVNPRIEEREFAVPRDKN